MNLRLDGKTALVCGSTQGIGLACATEMANRGARIVLFARNREKMAETMTKMREEGEAKIKEILTAKQKEDMESLKGPEFKFPQPQWGNFGGGQGGPGGGRGNRRPGGGNDN